jgi:hypothetical protein
MDFRTSADILKNKAKWLTLKKFDLYILLRRKKIKFKLFLISTDIRGRIWEKNGSADGYGKKVARILTDTDIEARIYPGI